MPSLDTEEEDDGFAVWWRELGQLVSHRYGSATGCAADDAARDACASGITPDEYLRDVIEPMIGDEPLDDPPVDDGADSIPLWQLWRAYGWAPPHWWHRRR